MNLDSFQQFFIGAAVLAALAGALWTLQRTGLVRFKGIAGVKGSPRKLQVIERLQLTPQHSLCLVRLEQRTLLIGTSPASCRVLDEEETV